MARMHSQRLARWCRGRRWLLSSLTMLALGGWMSSADAEDSVLHPLKSGTRPAPAAVPAQGSFEWGATSRNGNTPPDARGDRLDPWNPWTHLRRGDTGEWGRHVGMGDPLVGTSWQNRPLHVGWLFGGLMGDDLTNGQTVQQNGLIGGYRLGWDFDHYWGTEARFAFSHVDFVTADHPSTVRDAAHRYWDVSLVYYPWGDSRWRPFAALGIGWGSFAYTLPQGQGIDKTLFTLPIGGGVKYYFQRWMALRLTATDNWAIGQGPLNTMHNLSLTADVEIRFGGRRTNYFPYSGTIHMW